MSPREREVLDAVIARPRDVRAVALTVLGRHDRDACANVRVVLRRLALAGLVTSEGYDPIIWGPTERGRTAT